MTPDMMVITDLDGKKIAGERDASSELKMHLEVYRNRPDVARGRARASADGHRASPWPASRSIARCWRK